jgi:thiamine biosynthesis lipoprotein
LAERRAWVEQVMGMPVSIHLRGSADPDRRQAAVDAVYAELRTVDRIFSTYRPDSDVSRLRLGEVTVEQCDPLVAEVLALCERATRETAGYFDAWRPGPDTVIRFDPTGLVKGWAVERASEYLADLGTDDFYLNAGGDIALGRATESADRGPAAQTARGWRIGVEDPRQPGALVAVLGLDHGGVATSGTAHRGRHIVDPHSGQPVAALGSVTVTGPSLLWADVLATAAFARGADAIDRCDWPAGYEALAIGPDGEVTATPGMAALTVLSGWSVG